MTASGIHVVPEPARSMDMPNGPAIDIAMDAVSPGMRMPGMWCAEVSGCCVPAVRADHALPITIAAHVKAR